MAQDDSFLSRWSRRKAQVARAPTPAEDAGTPVSTAGQAAPDAPPALRTPAPQTRAPQPLVPGVSPQVSPQGSPQGPSQVPGAPADTEAAPAPPPPTLEEARQLTPQADFTRFVGRDVDPQVKNAALKTLFSDPQFNVMDGLDIYIDDYGKPDPLPAGMLERMTQTAFLGLFRKTPEEEAAARASDGEGPAAADALPGAAPETEAAADTTTPATPSTDPQPASPDENPDLRLQRHDDPGRPGTGQGPEPDPGGQR